MLGEAALNFGSVPFAYIADGFVQCSDLARLPERLSRALTLPPATRDRITAYLAAIHAESIDFGIWNTSPADLERAKREAVLGKIISKIQSICVPAM